MFVRADIGPAKPIATAMLSVASHMIQPIPDPAIALKRAAIASESNARLSFGSCSIVFVLFDVLRRRPITAAAGPELRNEAQKSVMTRRLLPRLVQG